MASSPLSHPQTRYTHPARELFGLKVVGYGAGWMETTQGAPESLLDGQGCLPPGALCVVADTVLGFSAATAATEAQRMVTTQLSLDFASVPGPDRPLITARGSTVHHDEVSALTEGRLAYPDGTVLAIISARFAYIRADGRAAAEVSAGRTDVATYRPGPWSANHPLVDGAPVYEMLQGRVVEAAEGRAAVEVTPSPLFSNERGGLHGGIGALMAERGADIALAAALPAGTPRRLGNFRATFIRPVGTTAETTSVRAEVRHLGRSQALVRSELLTPAGKLALAAECLFILG